MKMKLYVLIVALLAGTSLLAQEMNVNVKVNYQKRQLVDPKVYQTLETTIQEFLNSQRWTEDLFDTDERINANLLLTIQEELSATSFKADIAISATRPVYGSDYETILINHIDKNVVFSYEQFAPLRYTENTFNDNLSSVLSFYVYIILGLDYDSFSPYGGEPYFQRAQAILNAVPQSAGGGGWKSTSGNRNRYWIIQNYLDPRIKDYRRGWYDYHRQGLDIMHENPAAGRAVIVKALELVDKSNTTYRNAMVIQMFANAKSNELVDIFKGSTGSERTLFIQTMSRIDAANSAKYRNLRS